MAKKHSFDWNKLETKIKEDRSKKKGNRDQDDRYWKPTKDENGNSLAVIRFLPSPKSEPFVKTHGHFFNYMVDGQKKWWVKECPSAIDKTCLVCKKNFEYWESAFESDKDIARARRRSTSFTSNIYVIKDPNNRESEGKVFLYKYGVKIFDKIMRHWMPEDNDLEDPDFEQFVAFDPYDGANFKLKVKKSGDFPNYDDSAFSPTSEFMDGDDKKIDKVLKVVYDLNEFLLPEKYPTEDEQREKLGVLLGETRNASKSDDDDVDFPDDTDSSDGDGVESTDGAFEDTTAPAETTSTDSGVEDEDEDDEAFFADLNSTD